MRVRARARARVRARARARARPHLSSATLTAAAREPLSAAFSASAARVVCSSQPFSVANVAFESMSDSTTCPAPKAAAESPTAPIWCCLPDAHASQIRATVEGVGSWRATLATERFPRVTLLHEDRPTVSDSDHLRGEAPSQERRRPHEEAAGKKRHGIQNSANTAPGGNYGGLTTLSQGYHKQIHGCAVHTTA
eukprot:scaffold17951_cov63-Phaeocystis_antarctica.AAC.3